MGADAELSPPPPPPDEERGRDHRGWKADMMSALGESVSFGRFLHEPLEWGRWSAFAHNRYLDEAARQSLPGSVAQKKAFFEAHYARRKRKSDADADAADADDDDEGAGSGHVLTAASSPDSSCMTEEPAGEEARCVDSDAAGYGGAGQVEAPEELGPVAADRGGSPCRVPAAEARNHGEDDAQVGEQRDSSPLQEKPEDARQDMCDDSLVALDAVEKQPLKESSVVNQGVVDSAKKRRIPMPSLLQKPTKFSSPPSGKKGASSSSKRRSPLYSAKENSSPPPCSNSSEQAGASVHQKRSTMAALHMSMDITRCEAGNAATSSRNLGSTIAERISQLESVSRPPLPEVSQFRPSKKAFFKGTPENAPRTSQSEEQRTSHVMRVKEKLFGSTSPSVHQRSNITKDNAARGKANNVPECKESHQSFCFKTRALPNFCRKNKQVKDSRQQIAQDITSFPNIHHLLNDVSCAHPMSKGASKEKQICCFPLRRLC